MDFVNHRFQTNTNQIVLMRLFKHSLTAMALGALVACGGGGQQQGGQNGGEGQASSDTTQESMEKGESSMEKKGQSMDKAGAGKAMKKNGLTVMPLSASPMAGSPKYPDAKLEFKGAPTVEGKKVTFDFNVMDYELKTQTADAADKGLANSSKGQHIHLIINNRPYNAIYEPPFTKEYPEGTHVALAFLSRSYHESVKSEGAYQVKQFTVGEGGEEKDLSKPALFYSRPKGTYTGQDAKNMLFDFYLHNTSIGADGNKVRMTVNGDTEFMITQWQPYVIQGLPMGKNTIKIELLDADGKLMKDALFNQETREFTLQAAS